MAHARAPQSIRRGGRQIVRVGVLALAMLAPRGGAPAGAAVTASLVVDGVQGPGPGGSIAASAFQFQPPDGAAVQITKTSDTASPQLSQLVAFGTKVPTVVMTVTWPGRAGTVVYTMTDVLFTSFIVNPNSVETMTFQWTTIEQVPTRGAASVGGQVLDLCGGKPVANAAVTLTSSGTPSAVTDAKGRFTLTGISDGRYDLDVSATGYLEARKPVVIAGAKNHAPVVVGLTPLVSSDGCD
jgi:hypothetical protein